MRDSKSGPTDFGDAGQVSFDVSCEYGNAGARKSLGHHLQRDGLSRPGRARHQPMPIGEPKRQPSRLLAFADKNLFNGIGGLDIGDCHYIAFVVHIAQSERPIYKACCKPIETFNERIRKGNALR
jgi:hypothetical protein